MLGIVGVIRDYNEKILLYCLYRFGSQKDFTNPTTRMVDNGFKAIGKPIFFQAFKIQMLQK